MHLSSPLLRPISFSLAPIVGEDFLKMRPRQSGISELCSSRAVVDIVRPAGGCLPPLPPRRQLAQYLGLGARVLLVLPQDHS